MDEGATARGTSLRDAFITRPRRELPPPEEAWGDWPLAGDEL